MEADGFQADTEDDDEDDCVVISTQAGEFHTRNTHRPLSAFNVDTRPDCGTL